jgi:uncharacterized protein YggT (Ycf19 family)
VIDRERTRRRVAIFIASIILGTTVIILVVYLLSNSWAISASAGVIAGILTTAMYPILFPRRS